MEKSKVFPPYILLGGVIESTHPGATGENFTGYRIVAGNNLG